MKLNTIKYLVILPLIVLLLSQCKYFKKDKKADEPDWDYVGEKGPENWSEICSSYVACEGEYQSPIDIPGAAYYDKLDTLVFNYSETDSVVISYNKRVLSLLFQPVNHLEYDNTNYILRKIDIHCPSEHTIHNNHFPIEIQLIHSSNTGKYAAISVLYEEGSSDHLIEHIISNLPDTTEQQYDAVISLNPAGLLPPDKGYYTYTGSLTTPPCSENVKWFILKNYMQASSTQRNVLAGYMPENNIRPSQKLNNREILNAK